MANYNYKPTEIIAAALKERGLTFKVNTIGPADEMEVIDVGFCERTEAGHINVLFVSKGNENNVDVRVIGLARAVPQEKRVRVLETCNLLNCKARYIKFCLDSDNDVNLEFDFHRETTDETLSKAALGIMNYIVLFVNKEYTLLAKALRTDESSEAGQNEDSNEHLSHAENATDQSELLRCIEAIMGELEAQMNSDNEDAPADDDDGGYDSECGGVWYKES